MSIKNQTTVGFSDIFFYAEEKKLASWNKCNDIFFRDEVLKYKGVTEIYSIDSDEELENTLKEYGENNRLAYTILRDFMIDKKLKIMLVLGD